MKNSRFNQRSKRSNFVQDIQDNFGASDYDMMMIFGTSASEQAKYLKDNPQFSGIVEPMEFSVKSNFNR